MSTFPGSPRLIKGAIIGADASNPLASVIVFQYNPDTMTRRLEARTSGGESGDRSEALRLVGPPKETITISIEVDATDQLETANAIAVASGINPTLAALEMLIYPKSLSVLKNFALTQTGMLVGMSIATSQVLPFRASNWPLRSPISCSASFGSSPGCVLPRLKTVILCPRVSA